MTRLALALLAPAACAAIAVPAAVAASSPTAAREPLASGLPEFASGYELGLTRVVVPPGVELAAHCHPGMQIARVTAGVLTMKVIRGSVPVYRGPSDRPTQVRTIEAGTTGSIPAGQWIVETPDDVHAGSNRGTRPVHIVIASLFRRGAGTAVLATDC